MNCHFCFSCYFDFSRSIVKSRGSHVKGKNAQKNTDIDTARIGFFLIPLGTKIPNSKADSCCFKANIYWEFFLWSMSVVPQDSAYLHRRKDCDRKAKYCLLFHQSPHPISLSWWSVGKTSLFDEPFCCKSRMPSSHSLSIQKNAKQS